MFKSIHASLLLLMTLGVSAPIIYADAPNSPSYIVGHGIIVRVAPTPGSNLNNSKPCPTQQCVAPKVNRLG